MMKHLTTALILALSFTAANAERFDNRTHDKVPPQPPVQQRIQPPAPPVQHDDYQFKQNRKHFEQNNQHFISHQRAAEIALNAFQNKYHKKGFVEDVDFEHKFSGNYYEVEIEDERGRDYEVRLDAQTGKVVWIKRDY